MPRSRSRGSRAVAGPLVLACRLVIGGIFLISGLAKIADPVRFLLTLREFRLLPGSIESFLAVYLPWLEFLLGLCVLVGILHRTSAILIALLNGFFIAAIGSVIARGIEVDCGCFGLLADALHLPDMADWKAIVRNLVLIGMSVAVARADSSALSVESYLRRSGAAHAGQGAMQENE